MSIKDKKQNPICIVLPPTTFVVTTLPQKLWEALHAQHPEFAEQTQYVLHPYGTTQSIKTKHHQNIHMRFIYKFVLW